MCTKSIICVPQNIELFFPFFLRLKKSFRFLSLSDSGVTFQEGVSDLFLKILRNIPPRHFHNSPSNLIHFSQFFPSCILIRIHPPSRSDTESADLKQPITKTQRLKILFGRKRAEATGEIADNELAGAPEDYGVDPTVEGKRPATSTTTTTTTPTKV